MRLPALHPRFDLAIRLLLGGVFIAAALPKLIDPPGFAQALWNYRLLPPWSLHPAALVVPWLELACGLALVLGLWTRTAAAWISVLLLAFVAALSINLARHHPVDCGCFSTRASHRSEKERQRDMGWEILRDLGLLLLSIRVLAGAGIAKRGLEIPGNPDNI